MTLRPPIFIGGTGRCGTTVLTRILGRHPAIFTFRWETQFLVAPGGLIHLARRGFRGRELELFAQRLRGRWFHRVLRRGTEREYAGGLSHDATWGEVDAALRRLHAEVDDPDARERPLDTASRFVCRAFGPAVERAGAGRWCEKTPRNLLFVDLLAEMFPGMRFLHILRDGRDVVASMLARGFWPVAASRDFPTLTPFQGSLSADGAARYWVEVLRLGREAAERAPKDCYLELRLEDLVAEPERVLGEVCEFLGEELSPQLLEQDLSRHHTGRWREELDARTISSVTALMGDALAREGYL